MPNIDLIEIRKDCSVQIREIVEDEPPVNWSFQRHKIAPGDDYSNEDAMVKAICAAIHTPDVVAAYKASQQLNRPELANEAG